MMNRTTKLTAACILVGLTVSHVAAMDNMHWYRARLWNNEPRSPKVPYQSFDMLFGGGACNHGFDNRGNETPIFGFYGLEDLTKLGVNVPGISNQASFGSRFHLWEAQLQGSWNFTHGLFARIHLPIRIIRVYDIKPINTMYDQTDEWKEVTRQLDALAKEHDLNIHSLHETGPGDLSLLLGYSHTFYKSCQTLDYIDFCFQTGVLAPTGTKRDMKHPFSIPLGYNGHVGLPLIGDLAAGMWDWFTFGIHGEGLILFDRTESFRPVSYDHQPFLRLTDPVERKVKEGNLWNISWYVKADHVAGGLSMLFGFSHDQQGASSRKYLDTDTAFKTLHDPMLEGWNMNTLHAEMEYDWSCEDNHYGPRIALLYNYIINGRNIIDTSMVSGSFGLDFEWCF